LSRSGSRVSKSRDKGVVTPALSGSSDSFSRNNDVSATSGTRGRPPESSARSTQDSIAADPGEPHHARAVTIKLSGRFCVKPIYAHVSRFTKETANNGARHHGIIRASAKRSFALTSGFLRNIQDTLFYRSNSEDFTGSEPGLVSREKNGTIKCLHDHFGGAGGGTRV
ncbi:hypothetical protein X777_10458, partial [Ooceraea biroi]